jgi:RNA polymerase sigma-70 factor (ECF subfamily)
VQDEGVSQRWALLSLHRERVVALMRARGVSVEDAEDCVHDALLQLMAHPALDRTRAGSLLTVVAMRRAYDRHRIRDREHRALRRIGATEPQQSPADAALDRIEAEDVARHVERLPRRQRDVVSGRAWGLSTVETARTLGITAKAAEGALTRARVALRAVVAGAGVAVLWLLRRAHTAAGAAPAMAATVAVGLIAAAIPAGTAHPIQAIPDDEQSPVRVAHAMPGAAGEAQAPVQSTAGNTAHIAVSAPPPHSRANAAAAAPSQAAPVQVASVNGVGNHASGANDGVTVQTYDKDSSFTQSVQQCIAAGVSLDPHRLGCPPR